MRRIVHRFKFKKEKAGQSIVLLAIGFIALIAFVGLVTDLSLLFVRYSALRRAVDSSAIAAAGQIREGRDYGDVAIAARQYIELHGLEPHRVFVETCETDIAAWRAGTGEWEASPHPVGSFTVEDDMPETELCQWDDPRKLVRVTAQIQSPTTFLRLMGWTDITLEATSVSETAVLDVALVLDASETMSKETKYSDLNPASPGYIQQHAGRADWIRADCVRQSPDSGVTPDEARLQWAGCCANPGEGLIYQDIATGEWRIFTDFDGDLVYDPGEEGIRPTGGNLRAIPDNNFTDTICQPFKQVKDAARNFIRRLDFIRGDRVALVTFAREADYIEPIGAASVNDLMMTSETQAMETLNWEVKPYYYATGHPYFDRQNICPELVLTNWDADPQAGLATDGFTSVGGDPLDPNDARIPNFTTAEISEIAKGTPLGNILPGFPTSPPYNATSTLRFWSYEGLAPCPDTNTGAGIRYANNTLTNVETIRKDAVWVIIFLSDGNANVTDKPEDSGLLFLPTYGAAGFCPWRTFCNGVASDTRFPVHAECPAGNTDTTSPLCNDDTELTRHSCLVWSTDPNLNGRVGTSLDCQQGGNYDADDYARDWADFAGLQEVAPGVEGNFVAMFSIGFGSFIVNDSQTAGPLLHYIADAGDNGFIDDDIQQDLRDDGAINGSVTAGDVGPCQGYTDYRLWCGQYFYAENLQSLDAVFEAIASRLFTRISR